MLLLPTRALSLAIFCGLACGTATSVIAAEPAPSTKSPAPHASSATGKEIIGVSLQGRPIEAYTFGDGDTHLLLVGGMHGGYEWNSVLLAWAVKDFLANQPQEIPRGLTVTVIPTLNPDGVVAVLGKEGRFTTAEAIAAVAARHRAAAHAAIQPVAATAGKDLRGAVTPDDSTHGRFNARGVDLNRNFDCGWVPVAGWAGREVSGGSAPFSEPEAAALRDVVRALRPDAAVFWHSRGGAVYPAQCGAGMMLETLAIARAYADAAGYRPARFFDSYDTTGDAESWLATLQIPAITVELLTRDSLEWPRNLAGLKALFEFYAAQPGTSPSR
jgi:predicted deacylase